MAGGARSWPPEILLYHSPEHFVNRHFAQNFLVADPEILCKMSIVFPRAVCYTNYRKRGREYGNVLFF